MVLDLVKPQLKKIQKFPLTEKRTLSIFGSPEDYFGTNLESISLMGNWECFGLGIVGAFVVYVCLYRESRILLFLKNPRQEWKVFLVDLLLFLICGGAVTAFVVCPESTKEAFMGGATWQGIVGGALAGTELKVKKTIAEEPPNEVP
jgi:hypothetical protein